MCVATCFDSSSAIARQVLGRFCPDDSQLHPRNPDLGIKRALSVPQRDPRIRAFSLPLSVSLCLSVCLSLSLSLSVSLCLSLSLYCCLCSRCVVLPQSGEVTHHIPMSSAYSLSCWPVPMNPNPRPDALTHICNCEEKCGGQQRPVTASVWHKHKKYREAPRRAVAQPLATGSSHAPSQGAPVSRAPSQGAPVSRAPSQSAPISREPSQGGSSSRIPLRSPPSSPPTQPSTPKRSRRGNVRCPLCLA